MMTIDREALREFCELHAADKALVIDAFEMLSPFVAIAESGDYRLAPAEEFNDREVGKAIAAATLREVRAVRFISVARAIDDAELETGNRQRNGLWYAFERMLAEALWARSNLTMWGPLKRPLGDGTRQTLGNVLSETADQVLCGPLSRALERTLRTAGFGYHLCTSIPKNVCYAMFYFLGFAVGGNRKRVEDMTPLMRLLVRCIPIGEKNSETEQNEYSPAFRGSGEWLVLVA